MKISATILAAATLGSLFAAPALAQETLNFGIISTESSQNLKQEWVPFLAEMEKQTGFKIKAFFAPDYAGIIEGMRFNKVQVAWFGNKSAMEAVDRAEGEIFVQSVDAEGNPGYWSHLLVHKDSTLNSVQDVLKNAAELTFSNGDPNSTSGFLVPGYYVFAQNGVDDPKKIFKRVINANHETNAMAVANKQVDVSTNNSENLRLVQARQPEKFANIKVIWTSPLIPADPIVWRKDMPKDAKDKIKTFFLTYGVAAPGKSQDQVKKEVETLAGLQWAPFKPSSNDQLLPIRQLELFKNRNKIAGDANMSETDKKAKLAEIDAKLADLTKRMAALK
ncbi:Phosphonates-binding periplasmic protein,transporter subunit [Magnetospirillum gryphiswaldense MSR-1 v2]|uniref:Phosphonates-binding periplasmic protein,transporter subunit n=1 Tax=Magnetospirillum gryphiswaldense (strain DSM 6361 / JCM 21280 / NBRC 15271 / MSR-1) TaxID=431944 RepID=V6EZ50_MAGGM|nr:phosphonate ABC transporter substrate-binding protein [Magnetospirillum gryphiswaldense]CDK97301.1 Phosphonates-binding periplasmic protein,transporter subunit [Magnetospirillum gryphiswaldense MSR-1 v2]